ncbi:MAG: maleylacetoacetate isomerase [Gammaproteobacteria bacterium]|nr:maleylacetoacetate isomerase [Gammaproteobacteria bacterium]
MLKLYSYWRSSASYRARIALHLKELPFETLPVHLLKDGGEQHKAEYRAVNPQGFVPCLVDGELVLNQSLAIVEYLDEAYPAKPLLPTNPALRAKARAMAYVLACDTHPMNNLKVLKYLSGELGVSDEQKSAWIQHWIAEGLKPLEQMLAATAGRFSIGDAPGLVDTCIPPLIYSAERFGCDLSAYPIVMRIQANLLELPAVQAAHPQNQPDAA